MSHWPTLVFQAEDGDLCRCDCGEQGFDFKQGREWFAAHIAAAPVTDAGLDIERLGDLLCEMYEDEIGDMDDALWRGDAAIIECAYAAGTSITVAREAVESALSRQAEKETA
jgi:hypothetical protein